MNVFSLLVTVATIATLACVDAGKIGHNKVHPFAQPTPVTASEKATIKFKPSLQIVQGCHPYPVVNAAGDTSAGLKGTGKADGKCQRSSLGSQVYGRAIWYEGKLAIMYSRYFPKDMDSWNSWGWFGSGHRHNWAHAVVWIDNPEFENPKILAVSLWGLKGVNIYPKDDPEFNLCVVDSTLMLTYQPYDQDTSSFHTLRLKKNRESFRISLCGSR